MRLLLSVRRRFYGAALTMLVVALLVGSFSVDGTTSQPQQLTPRPPRPIPPPVRLWLSESINRDQPNLNWNSCTEEENRLDKKGSEATWEPMKTNESDEESVSQVNDYPPMPPDSAFTCQSVDVSVPLSWSNRSLDFNITIHLQRYFIGSVPPPQQYWILAGGPGQSEVYPIESLARGLIILNNNQTTLYLPDHRGVGQSTPLSCGIKAFTWSDCLEALSMNAPPGLGLEYQKQFTTTNAAYDLSLLVHLVQQDVFELGQVGSTYILGGSYGTYYLNRFLVTSPNQIDGAILDGICPPDDCAMVNFDIYANEVGMDILARCEADPICAQHFPNGQVILALFNLRFQLLNGQPNECAQLMGLTPRLLSFYLFTLLQKSATRPLGLSLLSRLTRCDGQLDPPVLAAFDNWVQSSGLVPQDWMDGPDGHDGPNALITLGLQMEIAGSEMLSRPGVPSPYNLPSLRAITNNSNVASGVGVYALQGYEAFNIADALYETDEFYGQYPSDQESQVPILLMNGDLDFNTPLPLSLHYNATSNYSNQRLIVIPYASHPSIVGSPLQAAPLLYTCGMVLSLSFMNSGGDLSAIDTSCLSEVIGNDWNADYANAQLKLQMIFNTTNVWN